MAGIDDVLAAGVERGAVPGVAAVVVDADGTRHEAAAGRRRVGTDDEMTLDTVGALYSMTKPLTAASAMQLVERGLLSLDAPASEVCPELGEVVVLDGFADDGTPRTRPPASPVTLRQLLTHTSGFGYEIWNADLLRWHGVTGVPTMAAGDRAALGTPLLFDPGTDWAYGIGIDWAAAMVEAASGVSLGAYLAEHVTGPLGMVDTAHVPTSAMADRAASVHARLPDGGFLPFDMPTPERGGYEPGGFGLHGTVRDYGRFVRTILRGGELDGERVLRPETVEQMTSNQIGELRVTPLRTCMPNISLDAELFPGEPKSWGLSFQISEQASSTGRAAGTLMWAGLANSYFWIDVRRGLGGAFLAQVIPYGDPAAVELYYEFERAAYGTG
jgi:methyl acetate hydrolase